MTIVWCSPICVGDMGTEAVYNQWLDAHLSQLRAIELPESLWRRLYQKLDDGETSRGPSQHAPRQFLEHDTLYSFSYYSPSRMYASSMMA